MTVRKWLAAAAVAVCLAFASDAAAGTIGLAWSPSSGATGYRVHWGASPGNYTNSRDVGNTTEAVIQSVSDCADSYYAVTAYNGAGESAYSNEVVTWPKPVISSSTPSRAVQGTQFNLAFQGANFDPRKEWEIVFDPDPCVDDPAAPDGRDCRLFHDPAEITVTCNQVAVLETAEPLAGGARPAPAGTYTVFLRTTDGTSRTTDRTIVVDVSPSRINLDKESNPWTELRVDGADLAGLSRTWLGCDPLVVGTSSCSSPDAQRYDPDLDLDGNGRIDGSDLAQLAGARWGACWNGTAWSVSACPEWLR